MTRHKNRYLTAYQLIRIDSRRGIARTFDVPFKLLQGTYTMDGDKGWYRVPRKMKKRSKKRFGDHRRMLELHLKGNTYVRRKR